ncbi:MAG: sulfatase-like hydrolase/transferase, partial [bacterium]
MDKLNRLLSQRWPWFTAAGFVVLAFLSTLVEVSWVATDQRPVGSAESIEALRNRDDVNVLFILVDTLRADHLGAWGYERDTSPVLDEMASRGVRFAHQVAQ